MKTVFHKIYVQFSVLMILSSTMNVFMFESGLLILRDGAISHNRPQIESDRIIHEKSHKIAQLQHNKQLITAFTGKIYSYTSFRVDFSFTKPSENICDCCNRSNFRALFTFLRLGPGTSFHSQAIAYWGSVNNPFV